jgi:hypothetical protein
MNQLIRGLRSIFQSVEKVDTTQQSNLLFEIDQPFNDLYNLGLRLSDTPDRGFKRRARFYNLVNFLKSTNHLEGAVIECGCWKGLSSYLMCNYLKAGQPGFSGSNYHIFDSFEGLSSPSPEDLITINLVDSFRDRMNTFFKSAGAYSAPIDHVKKVLSDFPQIRYHKGWLPGALAGVDFPEIKFLHIDLDLYGPIYGTLKMLYPGVVPGGVVVCDDYGSLYWPGAKQAVEVFAEESGAEFISLSSGQAVFIKN